MTRKIIQIAVTPGYKIQSHVGEFKSPGGVVALCDDGSLWRLPDGDEKYSDSWFRLADIPQPKPYDQQAHLKELMAMPDEYSIEVDPAHEPENQLEDFQG